MNLVKGTDAMIKKFVFYLERICLFLNCKKILDKIQQLQKDGVAIDELICEGLYEEFLEYLKYKSKMMIEFRDNDRQTIRRDKIVTFRPSFDIMGNPTIILNEYHSGKDIVNNPLIDFELVYSSEKDRDDDIANLRFYLN